MKRIEGFRGVEHVHSHANGQPQEQIAPLETFFHLHDVAFMDEPVDYLNAETDHPCQIFATQHA